MGLISALDPSPNSPDQRPYCIRMEVQLEGCAGGPLPTYSWNDAVVADMVHHIVPKLYEVCVVGPGSAYLFFGRQTINEGPEREETHQIGNFLTGSVTWVRHPASMLVSKYPLVKGRQAVDMAWDQEHKEMAWLMHSKRGQKAYARIRMGSRPDPACSPAIKTEGISLSLCIRGRATGWQPCSIFGI